MYSTVFIHNDYIRYNICSTWFLDIVISTCFKLLFVVYMSVVIYRVIKVGMLYYKLAEYCISASSVRTVVAFQ